MGLSRTEIEVLLRARAEGSQAFDVFSGSVQRVGATSTEAGTKVQNLERDTRQLGAGGVAAGVGMGILAERIGSSLIGAFNTSIAAANRMDAALAGLDTVARTSGVGIDEARRAAQQLAADGLMTVAEAAGGLKNLLASGFALPEAIALMNTFRDSAAFNRQGMLGFGEAVVRATDGIKFGNSALTDSTGLGRNLSKIMTDAGLSMDAAGRAAQDQGVRQAILNGFLHDGARFAGDAQRYAESNAGAQAKWAAEIEKTASALGSTMQPILADVIGILRPGLSLLQQYPGLFLALGSAATAVVGPLVAVRAAAALGIPSIGGLGSSMLSTLSIFGHVRSLSDARAAIQLAGEAAGITTANLGPLGTAAAVAGAAFAGWQLGRWIAQTFDLDNKIAGLTARLLGLGDVAAETAGAKMDSINRAISHGAAVTITYTDAVRFNIEWEQKRIAALDTRTEAEKRAQEVEGKRTSLAQAVAAADRLVQEQIRGTGLSVRELTTMLARNEDGFKKWADANGLGAEAQKYLADQIKKSSDAQKKSADETKKATEEVDRQRRALEQLGIVTSKSVNEALAEYALLERRAVAEGVPLNNVLIQLLPKFQELYDQSVRSGIGVDAAASALKRAHDAWAETVDLGFDVRGISNVIPLFMQSTEELRRMNTIMSPQEWNAIQARGAMERLGITSREELAKTAEQARKDYQAIVSAVGEAAPEAVEAFRKMVEAQKAASGEVPTFWQTTVLPGIRGAVDDITGHVSGNFAQMLLGAKGFGEGFKDIWKGIKDSVLQVLSDILNQFINGFLKSMLGSLAGQKGAFSNFFGSIFGGGGGGGGIPGLGGGGIWGSIFGGGGGGAAAGGGAGTGAVGGAAGGGGLGFLSNPAFWTNPWTIGIGGGIALGTLAWKKGWGRGGEEALKVNPARDEYLARFGGAGTGEGSGFHNLAARLTEITGEGGGGALFHALTQADSMEEFQRAVADIEEALATRVTEQVRQTGEVGEEAGDQLVHAADRWIEQWRLAGESVDHIIQRIDALRESVPEELVIRVRREIVGDDLPSGLLTGIASHPPGGFDLEQVPGFAKGFYGDGTSPIVGAFAEAGEPELGGPIDFMTKVLAGALERRESEAPAAAAGPSFVFHVTTVDADGLRTAVEREIIPMIVDAISVNRRQSRTDLRAALGVA